MPSVLDAPELNEYVATHNFTIETIERPQRRRARPGFWRTLAHTTAQYLTPTPRQLHVSSCSAYRQYERPLDRVAREYPSLSVYALALI